jgi:hypothetical protein
MTRSLLIPIGILSWLWRIEQFRKLVINLLWDSEEDNLTFTGLHSILDTSGIPLS